MEDEFTPSQNIRVLLVDVKHKPGKENIVPDALSRLASSSKSNYAPLQSELNALHYTFNDIIPVY